MRSNPPGVLCAKVLLPNGAASTRRVLNAAIKAHHIASRHAVQFWVTEFSWDSNPPDPCSPPFSLLSRWVPEALYVKILVAPEDLFWPSPEAMTPRTAALMKLLFNYGDPRRTQLTELDPPGRSDWEWH